jgi:prepilin-type N-terminal cleavage/methylation domain-containing protein
LIKGGMKKILKYGRAVKCHDGFTLIEILFAVVLLGLIAYGVSGVFFTGMQSLDEQADRMILDSRLRGRMEVLVGNLFDQVVNGSEVVSVNGRDYTVTWSVALADIDGDSTPDADAKQVTVAVAGLPDRSLTVILVDHQGKLGKI